MEWQNSYVKEIDRILKVYWNVFINQSADLVTQALLEVLDREGHCSSIVKHQKGEVWARVTHVYEKISLSEHILDVLNFALKLLKDKKKDYYQVYVPKVSLMVLSHDIGKVPSIRQKYTHLKEHYLVGEAYLRDLKRQMKVPAYFDEVIFAVLSHHSRGGNEWVRLLREADHMARANELERVKEKRTYKELDARELIQKFLEKNTANVIHLKNKGVLLVDAKYAIRQANKLLLYKGIVDRDFLYGKDEAVQKLLEVLQNAKLANAEFEIGNQTYKKKVIVVPIQNT